MKKLQQMKVVFYIKFMDNILTIFIQTQQQKYKKILANGLKNIYLI